MTDNSIARRLANAVPIACVGLVVFAVGCRLRLLLAGQSFWYDEAYLLRNIQVKGFADLLGPTLNQQAAPPFFLWLLRLLHDAFGVAEWAMRLPAAVAGVLAVVIMVPLAARVVGRPGSLWAVAFAAFAFQALLHSNEVKPYSIDLLTTELILLAGAGYFGAETQRRGPLVALLLLAAFAPWVSYPAAFSLGGVGVAWVVRAIRTSDRGTRLGLAAYIVIGFVSCSLLWYFAARHQRSTELLAYWWDGFVDRSGPWQAVVSVVTILRKMGDYATTGMGIPMLVLVPVGWVVLARRAPLMVVALVSSLVLALAASVARAYPLGDRLTLFAAPLFWLPTAAAFGALVPRLTGRWGVVMLMVILAVTLVDLGRVIPLVGRGAYGSEFREAFQHVRSGWRDGDRIWQPYPEVYEVYHGPGWDGFGPLTPNDRVVGESAGRRLWLVSPLDGALEGHTPLATLEMRLVEAGREKTDERRFRGLVVRLYEPRPR